jgi:hypothetical protein
VNQSELRRLLLEYDADVVTVATDVQVILRQDKRRIRLLAAATAMTWAVAIAMLIYFFACVLSWSAHPIEVRLAEEAARRRVSVEDLPLTGMTQTTVVAAMMICTIGALSVAAVCTLLLVFAVRRAVLRQMNAALVDISAQLKQLNKAHGTSGGV